MLADAEALEEEDSDMDITPLFLMSKGVSKEMNKKRKAGGPPSPTEEAVPKRKPTLRTTSRTLSRNSSLQGAHAQAQTLGYSAVRDHIFGTRFMPIAYRYHTDLRPQSQGSRVAVTKIGL